jgi:hypothetical protein
MAQRLFFASAIFVFALLQSTPARAAQEWIVRYTNTVRLTAIAAGNGRLVAVGDAHDNKIVWSENGLDWQVATHAGKPYALDFGGGRFVAGGGPGESLMISENGKDWTVTHSSDTNNWIWDIIWFNGAHVALARTSLLRSVDGVAWERLPTPGIFYSMGLLNGELVIQGPDQACKYRRIWLIGAGFVNPNFQPASTQPTIFCSIHLL